MIKLSLSTVFNALKARVTALEAGGTGGGTGGTMNTARLTGRTSAGIGASEEISVNNSLELSGGVLQLATATAEYVNVAKFNQAGATNIQTALTSALAAIPNGGKILIPRGEWTITDEFALGNSVTIKGVSVSGYAGSLGSKITQLTNTKSIFTYSTGARDINLQDVTLNLGTATGGSCVKAIANSGSNSIICCSFDRVNFHALGGFVAGTVGFRCESTPESANYEVVEQRFRNCWFIGLSKAVYCNSSNTALHFDSPHIRLPAGAGIAFECRFVGELHVRGHHIVGGSTAPAPPGVPTDGSTLLYTYGAFYNISFTGGQDENLTYLYKNDVNAYRQQPVVFRDCLLQSVIYASSGMSIVSDSNRWVNYGAAQFVDNNYQCNLFIEGHNQIETRGWTNPNGSVTPAPPTILQNFTNALSRIYEKGLINKSYIQPLSDTTVTPIINASVGAANIQAGAASVTVYNNLVTANSVVTAVLRTSDTANPAIKMVITDAAGYFTIYLTTACAAKVSVGFRVENP